MLKLPVRTLRRFAADQSGATSIEYAMIASGIAGVVIATVLSTGDAVLAFYQAVLDAFGV